MNYEQKNIAIDIINAVDEVTRIAKDAGFDIEFDQALKITVAVFKVEAAQDINSTLSDK